MNYTKAIEDKIRALPDYIQKKVPESYEKELRPLVLETIQTLENTKSRGIERS